MSGIYGAYVFGMFSARTRRCHFEWNLGCTPSFHSRLDAHPTAHLPWSLTRRLISSDVSSAHQTWSRSPQQTRSPPFHRPTDPWAQRRLRIPENLKIALPRREKIRETVWNTLWFYSDLPHPRFTTNIHDSTVICRRRSQPPDVS